jgi:hypothetical protein
MTFERKIKRGDPSLRCWMTGMVGQGRSSFSMGSRDGKKVKGERP